MIATAAMTNAGFPQLDDQDLTLLRGIAKQEIYQDGQVVFHAGQADIDFFVVEDGAVEIINPADEDRLIVTHEAGEFMGDIDLLTRRPVVVTAIARGTTTVLRVPGSCFRELLNRVPRL